MFRTILVALLIAGPTAAQDAELGRETYLGACAGCHGADGIGDGPVSGLLLVAVPDLTQLSARNDGEYPRLEVIHVIDGRTGMRAHGGAMPVFGTLLTAEPAVEDAADGSPVFADRRILALADYLESIQK